MATDNHTANISNLLTDLQDQALKGHLLGDGGLFIGERGKNPIFAISRKDTDEPYLNWSYQIFSEFCQRGIAKYHHFDKRYKKTYYGIKFCSLSMPEFLPYYQKWYINKTKIVPTDLIITPLVAAIWFADDGCIIRYKNSKALQLKLATNSFKKEETQFLATSLEKILNCKLSIDSTYVKNKKQFIIRGASEAAYNFIKYIKDDFSKLEIERKNKWEDININILPLIAPQNYKLHKILAPKLLLLQNFSSNSIEIQNIYKSKNALSLALKTLFNNKYLMRVREGNIFIYNLTTDGIEYFKTLI